MKAYMDSRVEWITGNTTMHHRKVVGALRVSAAVTRLTVDRRHQVMVAWMIARPSEAKLCVARDPFNDEVLRILTSHLDKI